MTPIELCPDCERKVLSEEEAAVAANKSPSEILVEGMQELILLAMDNGLTDDDVDDALLIIFDERAEARRAGFKIV